MIPIRRWVIKAGRRKLERDQATPMVTFEHGASREVSRSRERGNRERIQNLPAHMADLFEREEKFDVSAK